MKIVIVTGAESGLGKGIANLFESKGYHVVNLPREIFWEDNMKSAIDSFIDEVASTCDVYGVINCFGINHLSFIGETPEEDERIFRINAMGPYWVINALKRNKQVCKVLNVSSQTYRVAQRTTSIYCASKAALSHMTKVMSRELAPHGWQVNAYSPGKILGTKMARKTDKQVTELRGWEDDDADDYAKSMIPVGRFMDVEEASQIAYQIFELPHYVAGETIAATGGV